MTDEKKATLKRVLLAVMSASALGRGHAHAAPSQHLATSGDRGVAPTQLVSPFEPTTNDSFHDVFNNTWSQLFGDLFVLESPFWEIAGW